MLLSSYHAPVVFAALSRPLPRFLFSLGCSSKFAFPPLTVIRSFGFSSPHSRNRRVSTRSGRVS